MVENRKPVFADHEMEKAQKKTHAVNVGFLILGFDSWFRIESELGIKGFLRVSLLGMQRLDQKILQRQQLVLLPRIYAQSS